MSVWISMQAGVVFGLVGLVCFHTVLSVSSAWSIYEPQIVPTVECSHTHDLYPPFPCYFLSYTGVLIDQINCVDVLQLR